MERRSIALAGAFSGLIMLLAVPSAPAVSPALLAPAAAAASPTPTPVPKGPRIYKLPFPGGQTYDVCQGNNTGTHVGHGVFAWDFCMAIGSPVTAARGGTVRTVRQDSNTGGWGYKFAGAANYVIIDHGDGTSALYMHLMLNGARVRAGDQVQTGQLLALSGNTGWTSAPHLHFMVMQSVADDPYNQSMPVLFTDVPDDGGLPLQDHTYTSGNTAIDQRLLTAPSGPPPFTPFWVETFRPTTLWSGPDDKAIKFGPAAAWQFLEVTAPQNGPRLEAVVAATGQPAFVPAADVGPSGPPPAGNPPAAAKSATIAAEAPSGQVAVAAGDTLYGIARAHQTTVEKLVALNGLKDPNDLFVGQALKLG
ncbi:MAG TPA: peptidoglycan DD-metalloendopeptidase family protein [Chloroflexota bacterium]